jgi:hypothetical protein
MPRQVGVGPVDRRLMEAGLGDPGLEIVADRLASDAAEISEGADSCLAKERAYLRLRTVDDAGRYTLTSPYS